MAFRHLRNELNCSICLTTYKDPVTLTCGHNFCLNCIESLLTTERIDYHSCPECRERLEARPVLRKNINLRNIAECFRSTQPGEEEHEIFCTYCLHCPVLAVKACTHCDAFVCEDHLRVHSKSEEHFFIEAKTSLEDRKCRTHQKILKYYCLDDAACICALCRMEEEHLSHYIKPINVAYKKKKDELTRLQDTLISKKEETAKNIRTLHKRQTEARKNSLDLEKRIRSLFKEVREQLKRVEEQIWSEFSNHKNLIQSISTQIKELKTSAERLNSKMDDIQLLQKNNDPLTFLREWKAKSATFYDALNLKRQRSVYEVGDSNEGLISEILHTGLRDIFNDMKKLIFESCDISLDMNTAGNDLEVSRDQKCMSRSTVSQNRPETPGRFQCVQVISSNVLSSGRHCWDLETSKSGFWMVGVCYPSIERKEGQPCIGNNKKSWSLCSYNGQYSARHNTVITQLQAVTSARLRVFLHYDDGWLAFYELCDHFQHLYTFNVTFTEPLHAAFWVWNGWVKIANRNEFCLAPSK